MLKNSVLWKLTKEGKAPSYLFGTMHVRDASAFSHLEKAETALGFCTHFMAEMDLDKAKQLISPSDYLLPDSQNISMFFKSRQYSKMKRILKKTFDFNLDEWRNFYPMMIVNRISELVLSEDHSLALDNHLWSLASSRQMTMDGLETVQDQISTLHALNLDIQLTMLRALCKDVGKFRKRIYQLVDKYEEGDIRSIYKLSKKGLGKLKEPLLYKRNMQMAERIVETMDNPVFYAAGAAHLAGANGVLRLVKHMGIKIEAV